MLEVHVRARRGHSVITILPWTWRPGSRRRRRSRRLHPHGDHRHPRPARQPTHRTRPGPAHRRTQRNATATTRRPPTHHLPTRADANLNAELIPTSGGLSLASAPKAWRNCREDVQFPGFGRVGGGRCETTGRWVSRAEVAEIAFTAFTSRRKADQVPGRLVVHRIPDPHHGPSTINIHIITPRAA